MGSISGAAGERTVPELRERLLSALSHEVAYRERAIPESAREAAVLMLWTPDESLLLTVRTDTVETHKGQIAFPGGMRDEGDGDAIATALREAREEVGVEPGGIEILGALPPLGTVTGFRVTPVIGFWKGSGVRPEIRPNSAEIAESFWVSLSELQAPGVHWREHIERGAFRYPIEVYQVRQYRIWGATGAMIRNLMERMEMSGC